MVDFTKLKSPVFEDSIANSLLVLDSRKRIQKRIRSPCVIPKSIILTIWFVTYYFELIPYKDDEHNISNVHVDIFR